MQRVANHRFLYLRGGAYYFRRAVPPDARHAFGGKSEVVVSLNTSSLAEARHRHHPHLADFDRRLSEARRVPFPGLSSGLPTLPEAADLEAVVRVWLEWQAARSAPGFRPEGAPARIVPEPKELEFRETYFGRTLDRGEIPLSVVHIAEALCEQNRWKIAKGGAEWNRLCTVIARGQIELARRVRDQAEFKTGQVYDAELFGTDKYAADEARKKQKRLSLSAAVDGYVTDPGLGANAKTKAQYKQRLLVAIEILGPPRSIATITRPDCKDLRDQIMKLPKNRVQKYPLLTIREAIQQAEKDGAPLLGAKSQNLMLDDLRALFEWSIKEELRTDNPARKLTIANPKAGEKVRSSFEVAHLRKIFSAPLYTGCVDDGAGYRKAGPNKPRRHRFWGPLLGLYTGMRLNEICQLKKEDIRFEDGVHYIDLTRFLGSGRSLKTNHSLRIVPIHPDLVSLGFLDHAKKQADGAWLFPEIDHAANEGGSGAVSKWFGRFLHSLELKDPRLVFHSFRHTFRDAQRRAGVDREVTDALGGWKTEGVGVSYGKGFDKSTLAKSIARMSYPSLDLSHLRPSEIQKTSVGGIRVRKRVT